MKQSGAVYIIKEYPTMQFNYSETQGGYLAELEYKTQKVSGDNNVQNKVTDKVTDNQKKNLEYILENKFITASELAEKINISKRKILDNTLKLKKAKLLRRVGNNKTGYWEVL